MASFRDRLRQREELRQQLEALSQAERAYQREVASLYWHDGQRAGNLDRDIQRQFQTYGAIMESCLDPLQRAASGEALQIEEPDPMTPERWLEEARQDVKDNFLWDVYAKAMLNMQPDRIEMMEFSEVVAGRALVRLVAYRSTWTWDHREQVSFIPDGLGLLASLYAKEEYGLLPRPADATRFIETGGLRIEDGDEFLSALFQEVPGARKALYRLLRAYGTVVRAQQEADTGRECPVDTLPDEFIPLPTYDQLCRLLGSHREIPADLALIETASSTPLDAAIAAVLGGVSVRQAAKRYQIAYETLRRELKARGISPAYTQRKASHE